MTKFNPMVVQEMVRFDAWLSSGFAPAEREAKRIEHLLANCKSKGLYEGPWERVTKYFCPEVEGGSGRPYRYPFHRMEVGETIFVAHQANDGVPLNAAHSHGTRHNKKFTGERVADGYEVTRIA